MFSQKLIHISNPSENYFGDLFKDTRRMFVMLLRLVSYFISVPICRE